MKNKGDAFRSNAPYSCMQQRGTTSHGMIDNVFSLKSFIIKLIVGIIGGFGMWYLTTSSELGNTAMVIDSSKYLPIALCVIMIIIGLYGVFELGKKAFD